ncbi:MAG: MgtC/SapB family protein [Candidatus Margulisiibacteriota bacterium]
MTGELAITLQLILSAVLGGVIGFFRERDKKAAGLRTHILVCMGSTLLMLIAVHLASIYPGSDVGRIAGQVIVGIGFLGAGTILVDREKASVMGLTTAASIWVSAAIGLAVGCGFYYAALISTLIVLLVIEVLRKMEKRFIRTDKEES